MMMMMITGVRLHVYRDSVNSTEGMICWVFQAFFCSTFFLHVFCNSIKSIGNRSAWQFTKFASFDISVMNMSGYNNVIQHAQLHMGPIKMYFLFHKIAGAFGAKRPYKEKLLQ